VVRRREDHEAPARRALRRADQVLRREDPQRLADRRAADAELHAQRRLVRQPVAGRDLAADDELAQLVGDLLVGLADTLHATEPIAWCGHGSLSGSPNVSVNAIS